MTSKVLSLLLLVSCVVGVLSYGERRPYDAGNEDIFKQLRDELIRTVGEKNTGREERVFGGQKKSGGNWMVDLIEPVITFLWEGEDKDSFTVEGFLREWVPGVNLNSLLNDLVKIALEDVKKAINLFTDFKNQDQAKLDEIKFNLFDTDYLIRLVGEKDKKEGLLFVLFDHKNVYKRIYLDEANKEKMESTKDLIRGKFEAAMVKNLVSVVKNASAYFYPGDDFEPSSRDETTISRVAQGGLTNFKPFERLIDSLILVKVAQKYSQYYVLDRAIIPAVLQDPELSEMIDLQEMWTGNDVRKCAKTAEGCVKKYSKVTDKRIRCLQKKLHQIADPKNFQFIDPNFWSNEYSDPDKCCASIEEFLDEPSTEAYIYELEERYNLLDNFVEKTMEVLKIITRPRTMFACLQCSIGKETFSSIKKSRIEDQFGLTNFIRETFEELVAFYMERVSSAVEMKAGYLIEYSKLRSPPINRKLA